MRVILIFSSNICVEVSMAVGARERWRALWKADPGE